MHPVLIISNSTEDISRIKAAFDGGQHIDTAGDFSLASDLTVQTRYGLVFIDLELLSDTCENHPPAMDLKIILNQFAYGEVVIMATGNHIRKAVDYIKQGVGDYITRPVSTDEVRLLIEKTKASALRRSELDFLRDQFWKSEALEVAQTKSPVMANVFKKIRSVAATKTTVLMTGETGTGKSLLAKLIHQHSNRSKAQFISVHCGAIPDTLLESELFGHEKGAFTGALRKKPGKFEVAHGGTIFSGRDRNPYAPGPDQAASGAAGWHLQSCGGRGYHPHQRPGHSRHQCGFESHERFRRVPQGSLLPSERISHSYPVASGTHRRSSPADAFIPDAFEP